METLMNRARKLFNSHFVSEESNENNQRKWIASVIKLGNKSILTKKVQRKNER